MLKIRRRVAAGYHAHVQGKSLSNPGEKSLSLREAGRCVMGIQQKREAGDRNYGKRTHREGQDADLLSDLIPCVEMRH